MVAREHWDVDLIICGRCNQRLCMVGENREMPLKYVQLASVLQERKEGAVVMHGVVTFGPLRLFWNYLICHFLGHDGAYERDLWGWVQRCQRCRREFDIVGRTAVSG